MGEKVKLINSVRMRIIGSIIIMVFVTGAIVSLTSIPGFKKTVLENTKSYMRDIAKAYGILLEEDIEDMDVEQTLQADNLAKKLDGIKIHNLSSSYLYVVSSDGTMMYHPTADKIGKPVENAAVKQTVEAISKGEKIPNEVIEYEFKGEMKYAGVYVNEAQDFILVATADKNEILSPIDAIIKKAVIGFYIIVIIALVISIQIARIIIRPIDNISKITDELSELNFAEYPQMNKILGRKDEIGKMARALEHLRTELVAAFSAIKLKSDNVMHAANALTSDASETSTTMVQVETAVNDIAQGAASQADETQKATETIMVMGTMVEETNNEVENLLSFANNMKASTEQAKEILQNLDRVNHRAEEYIDVIANQTNTTNASVLKISEATKLITAIAEETNLLSLNASIEAARAGEQGRGFAVVAAEIQKLAEQSNTSAQEIEEIIGQLLSESEKAVETMFEVKEIMRVQSEHVEQTDKAFEQIENGVTSSINGINTIATKTNELDNARITVVDVVQNLTAIAEENAAGTEETSASATEVASIVEDISEKSESLTQIAEELDQGISMFRY